MHAPSAQFPEARTQAQALGTVTIWALSQRGWVKHGRCAGFFSNGVYEGHYTTTAAADAVASALIPLTSFL